MWGQIIFEREANFYVEVLLEGILDITLCWFDSSLWKQLRLNGLTIHYPFGSKAICYPLGFSEGTGHSLLEGCSVFLPGHGLAGFLQKKIMKWRIKSQIFK